MCLLSFQTQLFMVKKNNKHSEGNFTMDTITINGTEAVILRCNFSRRGGGVEIDLESFGYPEGKMTAYQNYLGGGLLGRVQSSCNLSDWRTDKKLLAISEGLKKWFHEQTNPDGEWESQTFEQNQNMPVSAY